MLIKDLGKQLDTYVKKNKLSYNELDRTMQVPHMTSWRWRKTNRVTPYFYRELVGKGIVKP